MRIAALETRYRAVEPARLALPPTIAERLQSWAKRAIMRGVELIGHTRLRSGLGGNGHEGHSDIVEFVFEIRNLLAALRFTFGHAGGALSRIASDA